jgi:hypothetical protein
VYLDRIGCFASGVGIQHRYKHPSPTFAHSNMDNLDLRINIISAGD